MLHRNKHLYYTKHLDKVVKCQAGLRMFKAIKVARRLRKIRLQEDRAAREFQENFMKLYNQKPTQKRKDKISKLIQDQRNMLIKERILVGR